MSAAGTIAKSQEAVRRVSRPPNIRKLESAGDLKGLTKALRYPRWHLGREPLEAPYLREAAVRALGHLGNAAAVGPLCGVLRAGEANLKIEAARALGNLGDERAVECLGAALRDGVANLQMEAASALGSIGDARAVECLTAALEADNPVVRSAVARALETAQNPGGDSQA
jgi:HEAT repeat protein